MLSKFNLIEKVIKGYQPILSITSQSCDLNAKNTMLLCDILHETVRLESLVCATSPEPINSSSADISVSDSESSFFLSLLILRYLNLALWRRLSFRRVVCLRIRKLSVTQNINAWNQIIWLNTNQTLQYLAKSIPTCDKNVSVYNKGASLSLNLHISTNKNLYCKCSD